METTKVKAGENKENTSISACTFNIKKSRDRCSCCYAYRSRHLDRSFFRFPKDPEMCRKWVDACQRPYLMNKSPMQLHNSYKICSQHFLDTDFTSMQRCRLTKTACPSQFLSDSQNGHSSILNLDPGLMKEALKGKIVHVASLDSKSNHVEESEPVDGVTEIAHDPEGSVLSLKPSTVTQSVCGGTEVSDLAHTMNKEIYGANGSTSLFESSDTSLVQTLCSPRSSQYDDEIKHLEEPFVTSTPKRKNMLSIGMSNKKRRLMDTIMSESMSSSNTTTPNATRKTVRIITPKTKKIKMLSTQVYYMKRKQNKQNDATSNEKNVLNALKKLIPLSVYSFIEAQVKSRNLSPYGRRWSLENKNFALQIYLASTKAYNVLRTFFSLPSKNTLLKVVSGISIEPGFSTVVLNALKFVASKLKPHDCLCIISFDEMKLKPGFSYNEKLDFIVGYENYGNYGECSSSRMATHALVFMVRGLCKKWKQVFGYFFSKDGTPSAILKTLVTEAVKKLFLCGLKPVAVICDQGVQNQKLFNVELGVTVEKPYFEVESQNIFTIPDPPHLLKCLRNNFKRYNIQFDGKKKEEYKKVASWDHIVALYDYDSKQIHRVTPKLTNNHVHVDGLNAMKVSFAAQIFSHSVAAGVGWLTSFNQLPSAAAYTAEFCADINDIFDSLNSRVLRHRTNPLLSAVTNESKHLETWIYAQRLFQSITFDTNGKKINFPCLNGWILALSAFQKLIPQLLKEVKMVIMCRFTQDALENFFSQVRKKGGNNDHPTAADFVNRMRLLMAQSFLNTCGKANCEPDDDITLLPVDILRSAPQQNFDVSSDSLNIDTFLHVFNSTNEANNVFEQNSAAYVAGYLVKQLTITSKCHYCKNLLTQEKNLSLSTTFLHFKEYENAAVGLCYPSERLIETVCHLGRNFDEMFEATASMRNVKKHMVESIISSEIDYDGLFCVDHVHEAWPIIIENYVRLMLKYKVKYLNKNMKNSKKTEKKLKKLANC